MNVDTSLFCFRYSLTMFSHEDHIDYRIVPLFLQRGVHLPFLNHKASLWPVRL